MSSILTPNQNVSTQQITIEQAFTLMLNGNDHIYAAIKDLTIQVVDLKAKNEKLINILASNNIEGVDSLLKEKDSIDSKEEKND